MAIAYPLARGMLDRESLTIRPRGPLEYAPGTTLTVSLRSVPEANVRVDRCFGYVRIKLEGKGAISLMTRRPVAANLVRRLRERGIKVNDQKTAARSTS